MLPSPSVRLLLILPTSITIFFCPSFTKGFALVFYARNFTFRNAHRRRRFSKCIFSVLYGIKLLVSGWPGVCCYSFLGLWSHAGNGKDNKLRLEEKDKEGLSCCPKRLIRRTCVKFMANMLRQWPTLPRPKGGIAGRMNQRQRNGNDHQEVAK